MNILFLSIARFSSINDRGIYTDLIRKFNKEGHKVHIAFPSERRYKEKAGLFVDNGITILRIKTLNIQKTNFVEKGIATVILEKQFLNQIKKYFANIKFDLIIYSTPPITFSSIIRYIKNRDNAHSYLLLKDIFPQNAVDLGMIRNGGFLHNFFLKKEKMLYQISDYIGCMSPANVNYLLKNNPAVHPNRVEVNPNSIEPVLKTVSKEEIKLIRLKYQIPLDSTVFIYGGNLGKPQGIDFLIEVLLSNRANNAAFFVIVGDGTAFNTIQNAVNKFFIKNILLLRVLPKNEYDELLLCCDVGMIFLDWRFTIPNYPSRLLSYMEAQIPIISATDSATDLRSIIEENGFGLWSGSNDLNSFNKHISLLISDVNKRYEMGKKAKHYLIDNYHVDYTYQKIIDKFRRNV